MNKWIITFQDRCKANHKKTPEGLMYGIACYFNEHGKTMFTVDKKEAVPDSEREDYHNALRILRSIGLDLDRIREYSSCILVFFPDDEGTDFQSKLENISEEESLESIVKFIATRLSYHYLDAFGSFGSIEKVFGYSEYLRKKQSGELGDVDSYTYDTVVEDVSRMFCSHHMEQEQTDSVLSRLDRFKKTAEELGDEKPLEALMKDIIGLASDNAFWGVDRAYAETSSGKNEAASKLRAAQHLLIHRVYGFYEQHQKEFSETNGKVTYLSGKYSHIYNELVKKVVGQDHAVNEIVQACFDAELYPADKNHPRAAFLFAGPPGVGKTLLSMNVAVALGRPFKIFDMEGYSARYSDIALMGSETEFKNAGEGTLVGFVEDNPDAVILFDEIEKAHPDVTRLFLSILEGARLDNKFLGRKTDFSNTILIFTTNAGRNLYEGKRKNLSAVPSDQIIRELRKERSTDDNMPVFPPELCSRFASQHIVMFNHIGISDKVGLVRAKMDETCTEIGKALDITVTYDSRLALLLLMHYGNTDARVITGKAQQFLKKEIYDLIRNLKGTENRDNLKAVTFSFDASRISAKEKRFFFDKEKGRIIALCNRKTGKRISRIKDVRITAVETKDDLMQSDLKEAAAILVDPYYQMQQVDSRILGLEDYDSEGLKAIRYLLSMDLKVPIYLMENEHTVSKIDRNSLYMRGVEGTISLMEDGFAEELKRVLYEHQLQKKCGQMIDRRKVFDFDVLEETPDESGNVNVKFYNIRMKDSVDTEDSGHLVDIDERPDVKFEDVIGAENAKEELKDTIKYLEDPSRYMKTAVSVPKGILLYGPPGTGKTMLAKAMAGETDATFLSVSAAGLRSGNGEEQIRRIFETARKYAPAVLFIDEVDAIARNRAGTLGSLPGEAALLDMFLTQMDGFQSHEEEPVFVVAATNFNAGPTAGRADGGLDPAFLRRFNRRILIDGPNVSERAQFFRKKISEAKAKKIRISITESGIENVSLRTTGETLATLEHIFGLAVRNAARKKTAVSDAVLSDSAEEYLFGEERKAEAESLYRTAVHEASHAFVHAQSGKCPTYLTVIARGELGGYMQEEIVENSCFYTKEDLLWKIRTALAGRVGESVILGKDDSVNTGASADLQAAGNMAMDMITRFGMDESCLLTLSREELVRSGLMSEYAKKANDLLLEQEAVCRELIRNGQDTIVALAEELVKKGHLGQLEIKRIVNP